jgi:hypothetical protein
MDSRARCALSHRKGQAMRVYLKPKLECTKLLRLIIVWHRYHHFTLCVPLPGFRTSWLNYYGQGYGIWRRGPFGLYYWAHYKTGWPAPRGLKFGERSASD